MPNAGSILLIVAVLAGAVVPVQTGANALLGRLLGHPLWATLVSLAVSLALIVPVMITLKVPAPALGAGLKGPWWIWIGGAAGVLFITAALLLAPKLGAATFIIAVVAGQMVVSVVVDHFGLMGFAQKPVSLARLAGVALILGGLVVTQLANAPAAAGQGG